MALKKYSLRMVKDRWALKVQGAARAVRTFDTKIEGMKFVQGMDVPRSVRIFNSKTGKIMEERTYPRSDDPFPPRG